VDTVPDPTIQQPTDEIVRITSTGICRSDLHLYEVLGTGLASRCWSLDEQVREPARRRPRRTGITRSERDQGVFSGGGDSNPRAGLHRPAVFKASDRGDVIVLSMGILAPQRAGER
jgi:hypothetical protein